MPPQSIRTSATIPAHPERVYAAWLDAREHGLFTGGVATIDARVGGRFTAWDGYIEGQNLVLEPGRRIVQSWRSTDFPKTAPHSNLEVKLEKTVGGTKVTLSHSNIPEGQAAEYNKGWIDYYFTPMKSYFAAQVGAPVKPKRVLKRVGKSIGVLVPSGPGVWRLKRPNPRLCPFRSCPAVV